MRPVRVSTNGVSKSTPVPIDQYLNPTSIALGVHITGGVTYTVEHTFDDPFTAAFAANPDSATWYPHPVLNAQTTDKDGNYAFPPRAIRLNQTVGAGSAVLTIVQAGAVG